MPVMTVGGIDVAYERYGSGRPVVFLGGTGMPPVAWQLSGAVDAVTDAGLEAITTAARGVAPSSAPPAPYTVEDMGTDVAGLVEELGLDEVTLVGYSLGSFVTEGLAATRPEWLRSAVLMAGAGPVSPVLRTVLDVEEELVALTGSMPESFTRLQTILTSLAPSVLVADWPQVETWLELAGAQAGVWTSIAGELGQSAASISWLRDPERDQRLTDIEVPTLVVAFEHDLYFPPWAGRIAAQALPRGAFVQVAQAAHGGLMTHPEATIAAFLDFVTRA